MERAILIVKHDALQRALAARIVARAERRGLAVCGMRLLVPTAEQVAALLEAHRGKPFYAKVAAAYLGKPALVVALAGRDAVAALLHTAGAPNPHNAAPGSIRGDFALSAVSNCVHVARTATQAERELGLFFGDAAGTTVVSTLAHE